MIVIYYAVVSLCIAVVVLFPISLILKLLRPVDYEEMDVKTKGIATLAVSFAIFMTIMSNFVKISDEQFESLLGESDTLQRELRRRNALMAVMMNPVHGGQQGPQTRR
jgi:hypothetical protein